jgi:uracil-DNA glycosylase family 4
MEKAPFALCDQCPFKARAVAHTTGPKDAKIAVVSRSPGHYEALNGKSFAGPSGKVLDHLLQLHGVSRQTVLATNVVLCQSDGSESGFGMAQACCEPRLESELANVDTVIAAGREAAYGLLGEANIARNRGFPHHRFSPANAEKKQTIIVTSNPAVVLRDDGNFPELVRDFRLAIAPLPAPKLPSVRWTDNIDEAKEWVELMLGQIKPGDLVASDIETRTDESGTHNRLVCAGFATRSERAVVFGEVPCYDNNFREKYLKRLWTIPGANYLWHNGKFDVKVLRRNGIDAKVDEDSMLVSWALDERPGDPESGAGGHSLEWLLKDELGWPRYEPASVRSFKKTGLIPDKRARIDLYEYNGFDTAGTLGLFQVLRDRAINDNVWDRPYKLLLIRLSEALTRIELVGTLHDAEQACNILEGEVWPKLSDLRGKMRRISIKPTLNPNSPKQLEVLMYDEWGIKHDLQRPKVERQGKRSTDKMVREKILRREFATPLSNTDAIHDFIQTLDTFKELDKQRGTYLEGLILKRGADGRIYTEFKIHGTESGRISSNKPNLQNITRPKDGLPNIRRTFIPDPGCIFISADLSQAELRTIAFLSGDEALQTIYLGSNRSLHKEVAAEFYGEDYSYEQYVRAKNINFGVAYWQSAFSFAQLYHMPVQEAQRYIDFWWDRFPRVWEWTKEMEKKVLEGGEIQSPFGHKRRFYVIPADESGRLHVVKEGINFLPQNIAANITLWALINLCDQLDWRVAQPRITIHDSILVNCREDYRDEVAELMKGLMERAPQEALGWDFPFTADLSVGYNWGELNELKVGVSV